MKIKLEILEKDKGYLNRVVTAFGARYADKLEIYSFTDYQVAMDTLNDAKIDVLIAADSFDVEVEKLPRRCGLAYFVDYAGIESVNGQVAICKFQKADLIYKQILSIYSENAGNVSGLKLSNDACHVVAFATPSGGTGSSTMAAACAMRYASQGKKVLYLNLEKFGSADCFFKGEGHMDMSDVIFALKSKKANLALKLESCARQDYCGVYYFAASKLALDMMELGTEEILRLLSELEVNGSYDVIILDMDFALTKDMLNIYRRAHGIVVVGDGSEISNAKIRRAYSALNTLEQKQDAPLTNRLGLIYNKFSNKISAVMEDIPMRNLGGAPRFEQGTLEQILRQLSNLDAFDKIF